MSFHFSDSYPTDMKKQQFTKIRLRVFYDKNSNQTKLKPLHQH